MIGGVSPHVPFGAENLWGWGAYGVLGLIYQAPVFFAFYHSFLSSPCALIGKFSMNIYSTLSLFPLMKKIKLDSMRVRAYLHGLSEVKHA